MRSGVGNGWQIRHLSDRVIELEKSDVAYRKFTGSDGVVRVRAEPGMDRGLLIERAITQANRCDAELALRVAKDALPTGKAYADYRTKTRNLAAMNATGEESFVIGAKGVG